MNTQLFTQNLKLYCFLGYSLNAIYKHKKKKTGIKINKLKLSILEKEIYFLSASHMTFNVLFEKGRDAIFFKKKNNNISTNKIVNDKSFILNALIMT